ncbi:unnamed protein product [Urochloa humidicola]
MKFRSGGAPSVDHLLICIEAGQKGYVDACTYAKLFSSGFEKMTWILNACVSLWQKLIIIGDGDIKGC